MGILVLNAYGRLVPRRRRDRGQPRRARHPPGGRSPCPARSAASSPAPARPTGLPDLSIVTSLLSLVVGFAFFAGIAYAFVAIPSQTQLQEDLPEDVRGRVFGVLNMLVSVASFLPILIVGPIADLIGTTVVLLLVALLIGLSGIASIIIRGPLKPAETGAARRRPRPRPDRVARSGAELPGGRVRRRRRRGQDEPDDDAGSTVGRCCAAVAATRVGVVQHGCHPAADRRHARALTVARVAVVFTGGTISMRHDPVAGGYVPALSGAEILAQVAGPRRDRRRHRDRPRPDAGQPLHVSGAVRAAGRRSARRSPIRRSTAPSSSRAPTRSRRPRSSSTCSTPATRRSS